MAADRATAGLQFLSRTRADKDNLCLRFTLFDQTGCQYHRSQCHGNTVGILWEQLLGHHRPGRATGRCHKRQLLRYFLHEILGFLDRTQICTDRHLTDIGKSKSLECTTDLRIFQSFKLTGNGRSYDCIDRCFTFNCHNRLIDLSFVNNRTERTADQTHTTGHTLILIDLGTPMLIGADGVHATGFTAWTLLLNDRIIRTALDTLSAFDTLFFINMGLTVYHGDRTLWTDLLTGMLQTALTAFRYKYLFFRTGIAGKFDDIDKRRLIIFLTDDAGFHTLGNRRMLGHGTQRHTHGHPQTFANDCAFQKNALAIAGHLSRNDLIWQCLHHRRITSFIGHAGNFGKNFVSDDCF